MKYFGTDGIRGEIFKDIDHKIAFNVGNSLCRVKKNPKILVGMDTRTSGSYILLAMSLGVISGGGNVCDVGVCPTAGIAYLTKTLGYDFGVVISASHNPPDNNGIKIFDSDGQKISDVKESEIENLLIENNKFIDALKLGKFEFKPNLLTKYKNFLKKSIKKPLNKLKIVIDCCYGASTVVAPKLFKEVGAKVFVINGVQDGEKINVNCGATNVTMLSQKVKQLGADLGLAFDGDSDRVIAVDECGNEIDGDKIIYLFAMSAKKQGILKNNVVVGTRLANIGIIKALKKYDIDMVLTDIGDKYVSEEMRRLGAKIGGEKSGHIILSDYLPTGDGILNGLKIAEILQDANKAISKLVDIKLYPQCMKNVKVKDKEYVINNYSLQTQIDDIKQKFGDSLRILVRKSGTEQLIRVMVEAEKEDTANNIADEIVKTIQDIDKNI